MSIETIQEYVLILLEKLDFNYDIEFIYKIITQILKQNFWQLLNSSALEKILPILKLSYKNNLGEAHSKIKENVTSLRILRREIELNKEGKSIRQ